MSAYMPVPDSNGTCCDCSVRVSPCDPCCALPVITSGAMSNGQCSVGYSYDIIATGSPTSYGATGLPSGLSVNTSTGHISGTPHDYGFFSVTISATNSCGTTYAGRGLTINCPGTYAYTDVITLDGSGNWTSDAFCNNGNADPPPGSCTTPGGCPDLSEAFTAYFEITPTTAAEFGSITIEGTSDCSSWSTICFKTFGLSINQPMCLQISVPAGYKAMRINVSGTASANFFVALSINASDCADCGSFAPC